MLPYALCLNSFVSFELKNNALKTGSCFANGVFIFLPVPASVAVGVRPVGRALAGGSRWKWERLVVLGTSHPSNGGGVGSTGPKLPKAGARQVSRVRGHPSPSLWTWLVSGCAQGLPAVAPLLRGGMFAG